MKFYKRPNVATRFTQPSKTQHHQASLVDIKSIMRKAAHTGIMPQATSKLYYGDFTQVTSYQDAMNALIQAQDAFMTLPSKLRDRFKNDPQKLLEFLGDDKNRAEAIELGLLGEIKETPAQAPEQPKVQPEPSDKE